MPGFPVSNAEIVRINNRSAESSNLTAAPAPSPAQITLSSASKSSFSTAAIVGSEALPDSLYWAQAEISMV